MTQKAMGGLTIANIVRVAANRYRDREAIFCSSTGRRFTFAQINDRTNRLAHGLMDLGLKKGDVAAFLCTNRAEIVEIYFALAKIGVMGVPLNYRLAPAEIVELLAHCEAKLLLFDPWFPEVAKEIRKKLPQIQQFVGIGDSPPEFAIRYEELLQKSASEEPAVEISEEDYQYLNLTSGTTGLPKAYLVTHYNNSIGVMMGFVHDITRDDVILTVFPIFGRVGFAWCAIAFFSGARNVVHQFQPQPMLELIESEKVTLSNWVPTMASFVLALPEMDKHDLSSLRALVFAAAPLASSLQDEVKRRICPNLYEYYGLQETGILTSLGPEEKDRKPDSVGRVMFGADVRLVDSEGNPVPQGEVGEIVSRAPTATTGYYKDEERTHLAFTNGWFHTGDLGRFDDEGFLYLSGRVKDMIISGGQNVFSVEVEDVLMSHPEVSDCAVIGLPDNTWGEMVSAVVIPAPGARATEEQLIAFCRERLAGFKAPKRIIWTQEPLPRTPTGKVTKFILVERYTEP